MAAVGVLALQGGYAAHRAPLERAGHTYIEVRTAQALAQVDGLILPGGESTTHLKLIENGGLEAALHDLVASGKPLLATCAGVILCAREVVGPEQRSFAWLDVSVRRNGWGRQVFSFEGTSDGGRPMVFIRAPKIERVGPGVEILDTYHGEPVMVRQNNITGATFHPELTDSHAVHRAVFG